MTINAASRWRIDAARPIAAAYASNPKVAAVIIGGSTSRGYADRYSDIEIGVFWHEPPTDTDRQQAVAASGAELHRLYPYDADYDVWEDTLFIGRIAPDQPATGVLVEVPHYTVEYLERILDEVLLRFDPSEDKQNLLAAIQHAVIISGDPLISTWQARLADYPRGLALAVVKRHAQIEFLWRSEMYIKRGNNLMMLYEMYVQIAKKLYSIMFALNGIYYPGFKWVGQLVSQMPIAPPDFHTRVQQVFASDPRAAADDLRTLVEETYTLIERELPEIDVSQLRHWFRYRRPTWDAPPTT